MIISQSYITHNNPVAVSKEYSANTVVTDTTAFCIKPKMLNLTLHNGAYLMTKSMLYFLEYINHIYICLNIERASKISAVILLWKHSRTAIHTYIKQF